MNEDEATNAWRSFVDLETRGPGGPGPGPKGQPASTRRRSPSHAHAHTHTHTHTRTTHALAARPETELRAPHPWRLDAQAVAAGSEQTHGNRGLVRIVRTQYGGPAAAWRALRGTEQESNGNKRKQVPPQK